MTDTKDDGAEADLSILEPSAQSDQDHRRVAPGTGPVISSLTFMRPRFLRPDPALVHLPFLFWLVEATRPRVAVQIGLSSGTGYFGLCQALDRLDYDAACLGVAVQGEAKGGALPSDLTAYARQQHREFSTLQDEHAPVTGDAAGPVDLLIVDSIAGTRGEILLQDWLPRLSSRATVVMRGPAVQGGLSGSGVIASDEGEGLRAVLHGEPPADDRLRRLAALAPGQPGHSRAWQVFHRLGHALLVEAEAERRDAALAEARSRLEAAEAKLRGNQDGRFEHAAGISAGMRLEGNLGEGPQDNPAPAARIADLEGQVTALRASEAACFKELAMLARLIEEREEHIDSLLNSTSWRLTGPVRHVSRWVGRRG